jgi:hypothetical protein
MLGLSRYADWVPPGGKDGVPEWGLPVDTAFMPTGISRLHCLCLKPRGLPRTGPLPSFWKVPKPPMDVVCLLSWAWVGRMGWGLHLEGPGVPRESLSRLPTAPILAYSLAWHLGACVQIDGTGAKCAIKGGPGASAKEPAAEGTGRVGSEGRSPKAEVFSVAPRTKPYPLPSGYRLGREGGALGQKYSTCWDLGDPRLAV